MDMMPFYIVITRKGISKLHSPQGWWQRIKRALDEPRGDVERYVLEFLDEIRCNLNRPRNAPMACNMQIMMTVRERMPLTATPGIHAQPIMDAVYSLLGEGLARRVVVTYTNSPNNTYAYAILKGTTPTGECACYSEKAAEIMSQGPVGYVARGIQSLITKL